MEVYKYQKEVFGLLMAIVSFLFGLFIVYVAFLPDNPTVTWLIIFLIISFLILFSSGVSIYTWMCSRGKKVSISETDLFIPDFLTPKDYYAFRISDLLDESKYSFNQELPSTIIIQEKGKKNGLLRGKNIIIQSNLFESRLHFEQFREKFIQVLNL